MSAGIPSVSQAAAGAYRDLGTVLLALGRLSIIAIVIATGIEIAGLMLPDRSAQPSLATLIAFVLNLIEGFLLTPYLIAVHRLIVLGEVTKNYRFAPNEARFQQFFGWSVALTLVWFVLTFVVSLLTATAVILQIVVTLVALILFLIVSLRLTIIFPAVAVDAPGATWQNVVADTKGHVWRIFWIDLVAFLPLAVVAVVLAFSVSGRTTALSAPNIASVIVSAVLGVAGRMLFVVIASRFYLWIGNRTKGLPASA